MLIFLIVKMIGALMSTFGPDYAMFIAGRFILGIGSSACFLTGYVLRKFLHYTLNKSLTSVTKLCESNNF